MISENSFTRFGYDAESRVRSDLNKIVERLGEGTERTLILVGSYGRGEGGLRSDDDAPQPVNDYDIIVVTNSADQIEVDIAQLEQELAVPTLDVQIMDKGELPTRPPTMFNYDLRYGGTVIYGDESIFQELPNYEPAEITAHDAYILLTNRMAGVLGGLANERQATYRRTQRIKLRLAWLDSLLIEAGEYEVEYKSKMSRVRELQEADRLNVRHGERLLEFISEAYELKFESLQSDSGLSGELADDIRLTNAVSVPILERLFGPVSETAPYAKFLGSEFPSARSIWNAFRLFQDGALSYRQIPKASLYCSETTVRLLVAAELCNLVLPDQKYPNVRKIVEMLYSDQSITDRERSKRVFKMWDCLFH
mgnify:FL=1